MASMNRALKKLIWGGLFALVFIAGVLTSFTPSAAESCCKKMCGHKDKTQKDAETCCKQSCEKK
jgi:hypothetical protein